MATVPILSEDEISASSFALPALCVAAGLASTLCVGMTFGRLHYARELNTEWLSLGVLVMVSVALDRLRVRRVALAARLFAIFITISVLSALASAVLATSARPFADDLLAAIDAHLFFGFDWPTMAHRFAPYVTMLTLLSLAYASLTFQPMLLLGWLSINYRETEAWRFITAWGLALLLCVLIFPWLPAVGGYVHFRISPTETPGVHVAAAWQAAVLLDKLRDGGLLVLDQRSLDGIITMPSFHAAAAVLLGWGFWHIRWLRWPMSTLNVMMFISAVPIGGHYIIDVVIGTLVALVAILLTGILCRTVRLGTLSPSYPRRGRASPA